MRDASKIEKTCDCPQKIVMAEDFENQVKELLLSVFENQDLMNGIELAENEKQIAKQRFERVRDLYMAGELPRDFYDVEKQNYELIGQNEYLQLTDNADIISVIRETNPVLRDWHNRTLFDRKVVFLNTLETVYVRDKACAAIEPKVAFYPLFERYLADTISASNAQMGSRRGRHE